MADPLQTGLIAALRNPAVLAADAPVEVIETHISWVLLAGEFAYKIKKSVDLGFVDFSTLARRRRFCEEELRLNRRLAPDLYLDVVPITGTVDSPLVGGTGEAFEYAVRMRRFSQEALLPRVLQRGELTAEHIDALAADIADFHGRIAVAGPDNPFGTADRVCEPVRGNFPQLHFPGAEAEFDPRVSRLQDWSAREYRGRWQDFEHRKAEGFIRECHGDMHLGNMLLADGRITIFDGIEFNDILRWIDVTSEVAFLVMDLQERGRADYAWRLLNGYLEATGDYPGLCVLRYYRTYRALVRAKVACIRAGQPGLPADHIQHSREEFAGYLQLAEDTAAPAVGALIITHGVSGTGKTTHTQSLLEQLGAIRVRSDVERKRLGGLSAQSRSSPSEKPELYGAAMSERTYLRLAKLAEGMLAAGYPVIADATYLRRAERTRMRELARRLGVPFLILDCRAEAATLRRRLEERARLGRDASEADTSQLAAQRQTLEPLDESERDSAVVIDEDHPLQPQVILRRMATMDK